MKILDTIPVIEGELVIRRSGIHILGEFDELTGNVTPTKVESYISDSDLVKSIKSEWKRKYGNEIKLTVNKRSVKVKNKVFMYVKKYRRKVNYFICIHSDLDKLKERKEVVK